jgi:hypothetical protein
MFIPRLKPRVGIVFVLTRSRELLEALAPVLAAPGRQAVPVEDWEHLGELYLDAPPTALFLADAFADGSGRGRVDGSCGAFSPTSRRAR